MSSRAWIKLLQLLIILEISSSLSGMLVDRPMNTVTVVGYRTSITCSTDLEGVGVHWQLLREGQYTTVVLYNRGVNPEYMHRIDVERYNDSNGHYYFNLVINQTQLDDAGVFTCQDENGIGQAEGSALVVLESDPVCKKTSPEASVSRSPNGSVEYLIPNETAFINCSVRFRGMHPPIFAWRDCPAAAPGSNITYISADTFGSASVVVRARREPTITCGLTMDFSQVKDGGRADKRIPTYSFNTSNVIAVRYGVENVIITATNLSVLPPGSVVSAEADAYPPAEYLWEISGSNGTSFIMDSSNVTLTDEGEYDIVCNATNTVRNQNYNVAVRVHVTVSIHSQKRPPQTAAAKIVLIVILLSLLLLLVLLFFLFRQNEWCRNKLQGCTSSSERRPKYFCDCPEKNFDENTQPLAGDRKVRSLHCTDCNKLSRRPTAEIINYNPVLL